ncbi:MAG: hypothetical protein RMZ41_031320 [Nostoc sp. DedVER02]|uniref:hypothetical protein n=1 Tax=unclassified Nostoc TaxID=2593658 RepID=UPI002AD469BD|nr:MULTISPECIES: hypothetical protein [unclassified Nostoc]MDZ7989527.1 hypothetical protein [Nostoc sp. DedVER02]MDZ8116072.1 hypothetical protein [Nostoc sp. DedVER01b]
MINQKIEILPQIYYTHKIDHRNNSPEKSQWTISELQERNCFQLSLQSCLNQSPYISWGLYFEDDRVVYLGTSASNEPDFYQLFIAKFIDSSQNSNWHGYPANPSCGKNQDIPPVNILRDWQQQNYLRTTTIRKISKGQRCRL